MTELVADREVLREFLSFRLGAEVDAVSDVMSLSAAQIKPTPEFSAALETQFITGLGMIDERMLILLDIEKLMTSRDMQLVGEARSGAAQQGPEIASNIV